MAVDVLSNTSEPSHINAWGDTEFEQCLADLKRRIGRFGWMWWLLRRRMRAKGGFPWRVYSILRRLVSSKRPYFVGTTKDGTKFIGDARELYDVVSTISDHGAGELIGFLKQRAAVCSGNYIDVGTNTGIVAASVARSVQGTGKTVTAFEPVPAAAMRAAATFALNKLDNVSLYPCAVGEHDGALTLRIPVGGSAFASAHLESEGATSVSVPCVTLDSLRRKIAPIGLIKVDVEGHEPSVFRGGRQMIKEFKPEIVFEYTPSVAKNWEIGDVMELIEEAGPYTSAVVKEDGELGSMPSCKPSHYLDVFCRPVE